MPVLRKTWLARVRMPLRVERSSAMRPVARRLDMIAIKPVELGVEVLGQQALLRAELHGVREGLLQARDVTLRVSVPDHRPRRVGDVEIIRAAAAASSSSAAGCKRRTRANSAGSSIRRRSNASARRIEEQDADIHPLVADQVRRVAHHVISARAQCLCSEVLAWFTSSLRASSLPVGKGLAAGIARRDDQFADPRAPPVEPVGSVRRAFSYSSLYHSGGMLSAISPSCGPAHAFLDAVEPRLKGIDSGDVLVDAVARYRARATARRENSTRRR